MLNFDNNNKYRFNQMKTIFFFLLLSLQVFPQVYLPEFKVNEYLNEQFLSFNYDEDISVYISAPSPDEFIKGRPTALIYFALPNGNSTAQTMGKILQPGDDWHFDIQHIGAQTRFLRDKVEDYNFITVYLENSQKSWPAWKASHLNYYSIVKSLSDSILSLFEDYDPFIILSGHSGGGRYIFSFIDAYESIPAVVKRICFLDSNYGYEEIYGNKITSWLKSSNDHFLSVLAYNDSVVVMNGKPIVSPTGGTWYRTKMMQMELSDYFDFTSSEDENFITHSALNGRIFIALKKNPNGEVFHTVQVERNGFIHSILSGTEYENKGYIYFRERVYEEYLR
jgi:hypothetical protein